VRQKFKSRTISNCYLRSSPRHGHHCSPTFPNHSADPVRASLCSRPLREVSKGQEAIEAALDVFDRRGERWCFAEHLRVNGEIILMEGGEKTAAIAEKLFRRSIDCAQRQGALSWELRSVSSLARLWLAQSRSEEAHALLAPVYGGFTEGFATSDLKMAKRLLDGLM
jgi:hypothetical protein